MYLTQHFQIPYTFPVFFGHGIWTKNNPALNDFFRESPVRKIQVIVEETLLHLLPRLKEQIHAKLSACLPDGENAELSALPGGESSKTLETVLALCQAFEHTGLCRHSAVIAIGGGAFLDTVGMAASLTHRGIRLIRMPTTPLAQADSAVGVKNGINAYGKKNFLGCFQPPFAVFTDFDFLQTLSQSEWLAGVPEAVKVAMIKDADFFNDLMGSVLALTARNESVMESLIIRSAQWHLLHIAGGGDPFETGSARPLDFGHWAAHKLEAMSGYRMGHGAAVAIGLLIDTHIAADRGLISHAVFEQLFAFFRQLGFAVCDPALFERKAGRLILLDGLDEFREHLGGTLQITLPDGIGNMVQVSTIDDSEVEAALTSCQA